MPLRDLLHRPQSSNASHPGSKQSFKQRPVWLCAAGWSLAHVCFGALLFDFGAAPAIWLLLIVTSLLSVSPSGAVPLWLRRWAPAAMFCLVLIGMTLPAWALFLMALPMMVLFVSLTLIGNQPVQASLSKSLSVYAGSTLFISLVGFLFGLGQGDRLNSGQALVYLSGAALVLSFCTPSLWAWTRARAIEPSEQGSEHWASGEHRDSLLNNFLLNALLQPKSLWLHGGVASVCLGLGAWAIHSPWAIALMDPTIAPPRP